MHQTAASPNPQPAHAAHWMAADPDGYAAGYIPRVIPDPVYLLKGNPAHPEHDELGLRNPEGIEAPDLVLIGGGVVYGAGVRAEQCWPALLQKRMGTGVLNAGMTGWGSVQYALAAEELTTMAPRRVIACLNPASDLIQAFTCASLSDSLLARSFFDPDWTSLPQPDTTATNRAGRAIDRMAAEHPDLADEDILALLAQRGEPDVDPCVLEASRFYLAEHSLLAMQDLEHPVVEAGLSITVKVLAHLRRLSEERDFSLTILLMPTREYLVYQRLDEAQVRDREMLERLGLAEASVLGELRAACAGLGVRCFDLTNYLKHFVGSRIHTQNSRQGQLTTKGCELLARFVRERVLPGTVVRAPLRAAVGGAYPMF